MNSRASQALDRLIPAGLLATMVFAALAHGAVEPWSVAACSWAVIALVAAWAVKMIVDKQVSVRIPASALPLIALVALGAAQSVALVGGAGGRRGLSMDVEATRKVTSLLGLWVAAFLIAANFLTGAKRLKALIWFLSYYGLAMAVFAILQHFTWNGLFYWTRPMGSLTSPFGPFINHNLFAGYLELLVFLPAGMAITGGARGPARLFFAFASLIMGLSILLSLSRGGAISLGAGMIFLATMSGVVSRREGYYESQTRSRLGALISHSRPAIVLGAMACAIALGAVWLGAEPIIHRAMSGRLADAGTGEVTFYLSRGWIWQGAWTMICANPISGVGLGAYETAYPVYSAHDGTLNVSTAHNDYLQIFADGGGVGAALALWFLSALFHAIFRGLRSRDRLLSRLALGCGASILALLVHSFFDSNLQIPSTALLFLLHSALVSNHEAGAPAQAKSDLEWNPLKAKAKTAGVWRIV